MCCIFLQFGLVAAHLDPRNTQEWLRLAEMAMESGNLKECASCYWQGRLANNLIKTVRAQALLRLCIDTFNVGRPSSQTLWLIREDL